MKRLVLVGAGHSHAQVLREWARAPVPGVDLTVVSPIAKAPYSGMIPGWLGGTYGYDEICIDFQGLAEAAGARWRKGELSGLDTQRQAIVLAGGAVLPYDLLSLNVGATQAPPALPDTAVLPLRPLAGLRDAWDGVLQRWRESPSHPNRAFGVTAVGAGPAGVETLLAVLSRLRAERPDRAVHGVLVTRSAILDHSSLRARRAAIRALGRAQVSMRAGMAWRDAMAQGSDLVLWAVGAEPHAWQRDAARRGGLAVSERGFIQIDAGLRSVSHPRVFAAGDCAEWREPLPKAGVYAVRMGAALGRNLRAALGEGYPADYAPRHRFVALMGTGDGHAIASWGGIGMEGRWVWRWKDRIDRSYVGRLSAHRHAPGSKDSRASSTTNRDSE